MAVSLTWYDADGSTSAKAQWTHDARITSLWRQNDVVNRHGISFVELRKWAGLLIFNGRQGHDTAVGEFTRDDTTGRSVVDYVIGTMKVFELVRSYSVLAKYPESNHRPISFSLLSNFIQPEDLCDPITNWDAHNKYIWDCLYCPLLVICVMAMLSPRNLTNVFLKHVREPSILYYVNTSAKLKPLNGMMLNVGRNVHLPLKPANVSQPMPTSKSKQLHAVHIDHASSERNARISRHAYMKYNLPF